MVPRGLGIFLQGLRPMRETPDRAAKLCRDNGVKSVAMYACQQGRRGIEGIDGKAGTIDTIATQQRYGDAFRRQKIAVWIWGFPYCGREDEFIEEMARVSKAVNPVGWILDPEVSYKPGRPAQRQALVDLCRDASMQVKDGSIGFTSYGIPSFHRAFPWDAIAGEDAVAWGSPQLYLPEIKNAKQADHLVDLGIEEWNKRLKFDHADMVPAVPAFGANSRGRMHDFLSYFFDNDAEGIAGFLVWSWPSIAADEWRTINRWARWFEQGRIG